MISFEAVRKRALRSERTEAVFSFGFGGCIQDRHDSRNEQYLFFLKKKDEVLKRIRTCCLALPYCRVTLFIFVFLSISNIL